MDCSCTVFLCDVRWRHNSAKFRTAFFGQFHIPVWGMIASPIMHRFGRYFHLGPLSCTKFRLNRHRGWEYGPQNIKNFHFLVKSRPISNCCGFESAMGIGRRRCYQCCLFTHSTCLARFFFVWRSRWNPITRCGVGHFGGIRIKSSYLLIGALVKPNQASSFSRRWRSRSRYVTERHSNRMSSAYNHHHHHHHHFICIRPAVHKHR